MRILNRNRDKLTILFTLTLLFISCDRQTVYHAYLPVSSDGWAQQDTITFTIGITDSVTPLRLTMEVRNRDRYPYSNLFLFITHNTVDSLVFVTDTVECTLADKQGKWKSHGWAGLFQGSYPYTDFIPERTGNFTFKVIHGMRDESLPGINDIVINAARCVPHQYAGK